MRLSILASFALFACTSIVPTTVMQLRGLSPTTADPADLAVRLSLPTGVGIQPGTAQLTFQVARADTGQAQSGVFELAHAEDIFRVAQQDLARLRRLQSTARQWAAENDAATQGSLSVMLSPCRVGEGPGPDARVGVGIRLAPDGAFLPLVRNGPLAAVADDTDIRSMPECP